MRTMTNALDSFRLDGKVALITGGGKGIGAAIARAFADAGADVVVTARTESDVESVAADVTARGRRSLGLPADVNDLAVLRELVDRTVDELGGIDIVVNNAGGSVSHPFLETTVDSHSTSTCPPRSNCRGWRCRACSTAVAAPSSTSARSPGTRPCAVR
jgi:7-alpha-hydroxysteroid dehydrogenase